MNPLIAVPLMISAELLITTLFCEGPSTSLYASTCIPNILCFSHVVCKQIVNKQLDFLKSRGKFQLKVHPL